MKNPFTPLMTKAGSGISNSRKLRLAIVFLFAQVICSYQSFAQLGYTFSQGPGTYSPITGGTLLFSGAFDDLVSGPISIPAVQFNGAAYTSMYVNTNGHITLGLVSPGTTNYTPISGVTAYNAAISPFGQDLNQSVAAGVFPEVRWQIVGNELVVQWQDVRRYNVAGDERISFQARLNITNGDIKFVYGGPIAAGGPSPNTIQVGLRGATNTSFLNRQVLAADSLWSNSTQGATNTASCFFNNTSPNVIPSGGLTYTFTNTSPIYNGAVITSTPTGGLWSSTSTWVGGVLPGAIDTVVIADGSTVTVDLNTEIAELRVGQGVSGILNFNATAARNLVTGNVIVGSGGAINSIPTTGTAVRQITIKGNLVNNGACDLSQPNFALTFLGTSPQSFGGSGTLANGNGVGQIQINNPAGVTLSAPVRLAFNLDLINGNFNVGSNLTFNHTVAPIAASHTIRRSPVSQIVGTPTFVSDTVNVQYVVFVGQISATITTGAEIPASRNINALTLNNTTGVNLSGGDLNVRAGATALTLTSGVLNIPPSNSITFTNPAYTAFAGGSDASHLNGTVKFRVNSTSAQTRTIPIGNGTLRRQLGFGGLITGGSLVEVTVNLGNAPSGITSAPLTTVMGNRSFRVQSTGGLGAGLTLTLNWGPQDSLAIGSVSQLRVAQSPTISGTWTERSVSSTLGTFTGTGSRTTVAGINLANGEFFTWATTSGLNVEMNALVSPINSGCKSTSENVIVRIVNRGISINFATNNAVISGSVVLPNNSVQAISPVTINSGSLAVNGFQLVNLGTISMADSGNYQFQVSVTLAGDSIATNDTIRQTVRNASLTASANPSTVPLGSSTQLSVEGQRISMSKALRLTEITMFRTGTGQTPTYPSYFPTNDDMLEFTNLSNSPVNISGDSLIVVGTSALSFVFPPNTIIPPSGIVMVFLGSGTVDAVNRLYFTGTGSWGSGSSTGIILKSGNTIYDAVAFNAFSFPAGLVPASMWSGSGAPSPSGRAGSSLNVADINSATGWIESNIPTPTQTQGTINSGLFDIANVTVSWTGPNSFSASGVSVSTGPINQSGLRTYNATVSEPGCASINRSVDVTVLPPATPIAGFSASSLTATSGGAVSTVTFTDTTKNFPSSWSWAFTPSTVTFVNSTSATSQNPQVQFNAPGQYSVRLIASNVSGSDTAEALNYITVTNSYCPVVVSNSIDTDIGRVVFGTLTNGSATPVLNNATATGTYTNNTALPAVNFEQGASYPITVSQVTSGGTFYDAFVNVFIDYNQNGVFDLPSERVFAAGPTGPQGGTPTTTALTGTVAIPGSALLGNTRMRVYLRESAFGGGGTLTNNPCENFGYGEVEDYTINITPNALANVTLVSPPNNTSLAVACGNSTPISITWTSSGVSGTTYSWVASPTGNFASPLVTIPSNNSGADTVLTLTSGAIDALLSSLSIGVGDSVVLQWSVRAVAGANSYVAPSRTITLRRSSIGITLPSYTLLGPANNTTVNLNTIPYANYPSTLISANWNRVSSACVSNVNYQWQVTTATGSFAPALVNLPSNNNGADTVITLSALALDQTLNALGIPYGATANLRWRVRAFSGSIESFSDTFLINVTRRTIICPTVINPTVNPNPANICGPGSVTLTATGAAGVNQLWTNLLGQPLGRNSSLTVNATASTSVRARNFSIDTGYARLGPDAQLNNNPFAAANFTNGHFITATIPVYWNTVVMRTTGAVSGYILLRDTSQGSAPFTGRTLDSAFFSLPAAGTFTVPVGMVIPNGNFFVNVTATTGAGILYRTTGGAVFPYSVAGVLSITGTDFATQNRFYYVFDWNVTPICASPITLVPINVNSDPAADFNFSTTAGSGTVNFTSTLGTVDSVRWNFGDGNTSVLPNPSHTYAASNTYNVTLTAYRNGCDSVVTKQVSIVLGLGNAQLDQAIQVFPVPSNGLVQITARGVLGNYTLTVTNVQGVQVVQQFIVPDSGDLNTTIDLSSFAKGIYFLRINNGENQVTKKLVIE